LTKPREEEEEDDDDDDRFIATGNRKQLDPLEAIGTNKE
jgi:hypothetical protein